MTSGKKLTVVVIGATGQQGGAVANSLLARGHTVRAITRNNGSARARALAQAGATLINVAIEDTAALARALEGATSLCAMTTPVDGTAATETRRGISAADAAKTADVHLVFNSVGSANRHTGIPHFESKYAVEKHIADLGVRATVLGPVYFMENLSYGRDQLTQGVYASVLAPTTSLAQVAVEDIGAVAARVLEREADFVGRRLDLAGDELTGNETVAILSQAIGRPVTYYQVAIDAIRSRIGQDAALMYEWLERVGYEVDRAQLRNQFPDVDFHDFESWSKQQDWQSLLQG
jgi:uncharacterized protein YbjT (DUF2867 family)